MPGKKNGMITEEVLCAEYESVYRYVLALCRSETDAQDITQETFLKAMKASDRFTGTSSLYTWLCAIAKNLWLTRCRKQKREQPSELSDESTGSDELPLEQRLDDRDDAMRIHRILHTLSEPYKEVFSLRVFGQLSYEDIGSLFGRSANWACVTYHRARQKIKDQMEESI
jgi:RNA polymerase sigma-70 factor (ECF subfamily)